MNPNNHERKRWLAVALYALAMAWVEASVVLDLRTLVNRINPHQPDPLPLVGNLGNVELLRELATMVMLAAVAWLAGKNLRHRFGYFLIAFGVWDIFYYVFLKVMTGWPALLFDWDILFLLPLPWWGPVLAPVCIAALMIAWGTLLNQFDSGHHVIGASWMASALSLIGIVLALYVFMTDAIRAVPDGIEAVRNVLPVAFNWPLFTVALLCMAAPVINLMRQLWFQRAARPVTAETKLQEPA